MTVALLLCLTCLFLGSSKFVVLDSDFCVLQGIAQLWKKRAFAAVLIKKQKSWPEYIGRDRTKAYFKGKEASTVDGMKGYLDRVNVEINCLKEPVLIMMAIIQYSSESWWWLNESILWTTIMAVPRSKQQSSTWSYYSTILPCTIYYVNKIVVTCTVLSKYTEIWIRNAPNLFFDITFWHYR